MSSIQFLANQLRQALEEIHALQAELAALRSGRPVQPGPGASEKAKAAYEQAVAEWQARIEALQRQIEQRQKEAAEARKGLEKLRSEEVSRPEGDELGELEREDSEMTEWSGESGEPGEGMIQEPGPGGESGVPGEGMIQEPGPGGESGVPGEGMIQEPVPGGESGVPGEATMQDDFAAGSELGGEAMPPLTEEPEREGAVSGGPNWKVVGPIAAAVGLALVGGILWVTGVFDGDDAEEVSVVADGSEADPEGGPTDEASPGGSPSDGQQAPVPGGSGSGVVSATCDVTVDVEVIQSDAGRWYDPAVDLWFRQVVVWEVVTGVERQQRGEIRIRPDIVERFTTDTGGRAQGRTDVYPGTPSLVEVVVTWDNVPGETDYQGCTGVHELLLEETTPEPE